jgi:hypothetical protein
MSFTERTQYFHFEVPEGWINRSMIVWSAPPQPGQAATPNVLVAYDALAEGEDLSHYVGRQLKELMSKGSNFHLDLRRDTVLDSQPAVELVFEWDTSSARLKQRQIYSLLADGRVMTFVNTAAAADFVRAESEFQQVARSFGWSESR